MLCVVAYQRLKSAIAVRDQIFVEFHDAWFEEDQKCRTSKLEISKFFCSLDLVAFFTRNHRRTNHHGTHADDHHSSVALGVDWDDHADVFAIHVQGRTDGHWVYRVVLTLDQFWFTHNPVHWDVESMIVLRRKSEDSEATVLELLRVLWIGIAKQTCNAKLASFDPDALGILEAVENDRAAIGGTDDDIGVVGCGARPSVRLQFAVEELVESLEFVGRQQNLIHIQLMEVDEARNLCCGGRVVKLTPLFKGQGAKQLASYMPLAIPSRSVKAIDNGGDK